MFAVRFDPFEHRCVDTTSVDVEATLWARHANRATSKELAVVASDAMDRVAFWHLVRERTMNEP
jgi:hypothetical protein